MQVRRAAEGIDLVAAVPAAFEAPGDEGAQMFKRFLGLGLGFRSRRILHLLMENQLEKNMKNDIGNWFM